MRARLERTRTAACPYSHVVRIGPTTVLFAALGAATAAAAISAALAGYWVPAVGAALIAVWFGSLAAGRR